jgi:hypothetical protein
MQRLRTLLGLNPRTRQLLLNAVVVLGLVRLGLWVLPFGRLQQLLARLSQKRRASQVGHHTDIGNCIWAVNVASRYMPAGATCLARALTTRVLLSRHGYASQLHIGVAKGEQGQLEAHAWVESQGKVVIGSLSDLSRFTPLISFDKGKL